MRFNQSVIYDNLVILREGSLKYEVSRHVIEDVSLLKIYRLEGGKSIHFWKVFCTVFSKIPKSLP